MKLFSACPAASILIACAQWTEPSGVVDLMAASVTIMKNGTVVLQQSLPATSANGGGVQSVSVPTAPCEKAEYTATVYAQYTMSGKSLPVTASVVKDRTSECAPPPVGGLKIVQQTPDSITIECSASDCPNGVSTSTKGSTSSKAVRTVKKK